MSQQKSRKDDKQDGGNLMARLVDLGIPASIMAMHYGLRKLAKKPAAKKPAAAAPRKSLNKRIDDAISRGTRKTVGGNHDVVGNSEALLGAPIAVAQAQAPAHAPAAAAAVNGSADATLSAILGHQVPVKGGAKRRSAAAKKGAASKRSANKK